MLEISVEFETNNPLCWFFDGQTCFWHLVACQKISLTLNGQIENVLRSTRYPPHQFQHAPKTYQI